jgi:hypothetical protein
MVLTFTLQSAYSGATYVAGPFDISGTTSGGVTTLLGDNISKESLLTGVTISNIDDATTGGTIQSVDGICSNSIQWTVNGNPEPTATPTPTPEPESGQCYTYQVETGVNQSNYGVRYTLPDQSSQDELFSQMLSLDGGSYAEFYICSTVDPTLLDYTGGFAVGVGSVQGITRTGPNGLCDNNFDCSNPQPTNYSCSGGTCIEDIGGGFSSLEDCQAACSGT